MIFLWCFIVKIYNLEKHGRLLMTRAYVEDKKGKEYPKLLIDTASAYTILSQEILEFIGCNPAIASKKQRIISASGHIIVPVVSVGRFSCFEKTIDDFNVLGHTLTFGVYVDGLLGMDFLSKFNIEIKIQRGELIIK